MNAGHEKTSQDIIRPPAVAGQFYPSGHHELRTLIAQLLSLAEPPKIKGKIIGFVVPHAGYIYSGPVAAFAYDLAKKHPQPDAIVMGPSHHGHFEGVAVFPGKSYLTPLGEIPINQTISQNILRANRFAGINILADAGEHSLEVQLPFLQVVWKHFQLTSLVLGQTSPPVCQNLADILVDLYQNQPLTIFASSDLSHYHPYDEAKKLDDLAIAKILDGDPEEFAAAIRNGRIEACGSSPILTLMYAADKLGGKATLLKYANSGDTAGERSRVVGYGAIVFTLPDKAESR